MSTETAATDASARPAPKRLMALDALRGFDMFWIMGGDFAVHFLAALTGVGAIALASDQLNHVEWAGYHAYDLVFPLFMFLSGVSLALSLAKAPVEPGARMTRLGAVGRRCLILIILGIIYNFGWAVTPERFRIASVLGLIGMAYFIAAAVALWLPTLRARLAVILGLTAFVAILQLAVPVPGHGPGVLTAEGAINAYLDQAILPGRLFGGTYDPEGLLAIPAGACVTLAGLIAGAALASRGVSVRFVVILFGAGAAIALISALATPVYPSIKRLWTMTYVGLSIGFSAMLLAGFLTIIDVIGLRRWAFFFTVIGANSIGVYLAARFFAYPIYYGHAPNWPPALAFVGVLAVTATLWLALYFLYRRRIFLKV